MLGGGNGERRHLLVASVCGAVRSFRRDRRRRAAHKVSPGGKTDLNDCEWMKALARHWLIACNCVPPRPVRDLRDLTRYRRKLSQAQAMEHNRLIKLLEIANIKLAEVISEVFGVSGRATLQAPIKGTQTLAEMAVQAQRRMRLKMAALQDGHSGTRAGRVSPLPTAQAVQPDQAGGS